MILTILNNGLFIDNGTLRYAWLHLSDGTRRYYRAIALKQLAILPVSMREDYDLLGKQTGTVRGLHNAGINFLYAAAGLFTPEHIGVIQYYGAAADADDRDQAGELALRGLASIEAAMANFPQSRLEAPNTDWLQWYLDFITASGRNISILLGHPDPRKGERGLAQDGRLNGSSSNDDLATEQNELLFRGLAKLRENFVYQVMAQHIPRNTLASSLTRVAEVGSLIASRRRGSVGFGFSLSLPLMAAVGKTLAAGETAGHSQTHSQSDGLGQGWGNSHQIGNSATDSYSQTHGTSESWSQMTSRSHTDSVGSSSSHGESSGGMQSSGWNAGASANLGDVPLVGGIADALGVDKVKVTGGYNESQGSSWGSMNSESISSGSADSTSEASGYSHGVFDSVSHGHASSHSEAWGTSEQWSRSHATGIAEGEARGNALSQGLSTGFSTGLLPGFNVSRAWQTEDHVADAAAQVIVQLEEHLKRAAAEGGFMTNAWLFTATDNGASAAETLVPQAFHGPDVPTPVLTIRPHEQDEAPLRAHALAFIPWQGPAEGDPFGGLLWTRYATVNYCGGVAALTAPAIFEEGAAVTTQAPIPTGLGFYPAMPGDIVLGHQYSPETGDLTPAQVRLEFSSLMHQAFLGDTGFGKSVAAVRQVYEETLRYQTRSVVLDFGAGWRQLQNAPGLGGHVNILQLWPDAARPFRWNPLQIGRHINPETQWRAFADVFTAIAQMGVKRQKQELLEALRTLYINLGVLVDDPDVRKSQWGRVQETEAQLIGIPEGTPLGDLASAQRQLLAVQRSQHVGLSDLYQRVQAKLAAVPPRDTMLTGVLEGILMRMNPLVQGSAARQFAPGPDCVPVEDLSRPWGVTIIEGGSFLDEFGKAFLLAWTGWHLHTDMVARRVHEVRGEPKLVIVYEEANKVLGIKSAGGGDEAGGGLDISAYFEAFLRDARKYGIFYKIIAQSPSALAQGIISSCSNLIVNYLKNPKDKDIVLAALARSERGFHDEEWRRFLDDMPIGMAIGRFAYTTRREQQRPFLFRPLMLDVPEPTDAEIAATLGRIQLN